jgi:hypothetical protein
MKARLTTVLSLGGVLFAGSAAALVNTEVLRSSGSANGFGSEISVAVASPATSTTVPAATSQLPESTLPPASVAPVATQAMYQIGDAGLVTLDTAGGVLTVVSAVPSAGWTVVSVETADAANIEVKLQAGVTVVEFRANLLFGVVGTSVESKTDGGGDDDGDSDDSSTATTRTTVRQATPPAASPPATTGTSGTTATAAPPATATATTDDHDDHDHDDDDSDDHSGSGGDDSHDDSHDDD